MIRYAATADHDEIARLIEAAFGRPGEARLVDRLRAECDVMFELVARDDDGALAGHIAFSRLWADRYELYAALAPLSVAPERQRAGVGAGLVRAGLESAREFGAWGVIVLGDPAYYGAFGFTAGTVAEVKAPYAGHPAFQGLVLVEGAFGGPMSVAYPDGFSG